MIRLLLLAVALAPALLSLSACGKVGSPTPPGPESQVIYPKLHYPAE
jgi:hypothetical protein